MHNFPKKTAKNSQWMFTTTLKTALLAAGLLAAMTQPSMAQSGTDSLKRFFSDVKTYMARFDQVVLDETLNIVEESGGEMWISRPGKFRWNYAPPVQQQIVSNGAKVWLYDLDLEQVTIRELTEAVGRTPAILLAGKDDISNNHEIRDLGTQGTLSWVGLKPTYPEAHFADIRIGFENSAIKVMEMVDGLGQTTRITLSGAVENPTVGGGTFEFEAPAGVDVINEGG